MLGTSSCVEAKRVLSGDQALVAVEVISSGTGTTDRVTEMYEYADVGIPHY